MMLCPCPVRGLLITACRSTLLIFLYCPLLHLYAIDTAEKKSVVSNNYQCGRNKIKSVEEIYYLICSRDQKHLQQISELRTHGFHTNITYSSHSFPVTCPCAYDKGTCRQSPHMCTASGATYFCNFKLTNVILSKGGGLIDCRTLSPISFSHSTMGMMPPIYNEGIHYKWQNYYIKSATNGISNIVKNLKIDKQYLRSMKSYDLVMPTRMLWVSNYW